MKCDHRFKAVGRRSCLECGYAGRVRQRNYRERRKQAGRCIDCPTSLTPPVTKLRCDDCARRQHERARAWYLARKAARAEAAKESAKPKGESAIKPSTRAAYWSAEAQRAREAQHYWDRVAREAAEKKKARTTFQEHKK